MSDYLWDKTGEAEEDVERLEELLGQFRHRPRALELPAEAEGSAPAGLRAQRVFRPAWLAAAAVLLLFVLAGALFVIRRGASGVGSGTQTAGQVPRVAPHQDSPRQATPPAVVEPGRDETTTGENEVVRRDERSGAGVRDVQTGDGGRTVKDERAVQQVIPRETKRRPGVGEVALKQRGGVTNAGFRHNEIEAGAPPVVAASAPLEERQQQAKEELMYALRLIGLKLKDVQRKTQKVDGWKSAFDEQKRIR
jgi:hypothetical protein